MSAILATRGAVQYARLSALLRALLVLDAVLYLQLIATLFQNYVAEQVNHAIPAILAISGTVLIVALPLTLPHRRLPLLTSSQEPLPALLPLLGA